jgi:UDP-glucose:glycoprotein glucosyltransferase
VFPTIAENLPVAFLYGNFEDSDATQEFHTVLRNLAETYSVRYVFRHYFGWPFEEPSSFLNVQGFGIDLALKSMEYKVIDDSKQQEGSLNFFCTINREDTKENQEDVGPVQGLDFQKLAKKWPEYSSELLSLKASLLEQEFDLDKLKVWEVAGNAPPLLNLIHCLFSLFNSSYLLLHYIQ